MTVYLFQPRGGKATHAVRTRHASMGDFELDRVFGGGFKVACGLDTVPGVLSPKPKLAAFVSCKKCRRKLDVKGKQRVWNPTSLRKADRPRVLGIPG